VAPLPVIAVTSGEPAGIGPDICLALARARPACRPVILADRELLVARAAQLGLAARMRAFDPAQAPAAGELEVLHLPLVVPATAGRLAAANSAWRCSCLPIFDGLALIETTRSGAASARRLKGLMP